MWKIKLELNSHSTLIGGHSLSMTWYWACGEPIIQTLIIVSSRICCCVSLFGRPMLKIIWNYVGMIWLELPACNHGGNPCLCYCWNINGPPIAQITQWAVARLGYEIDQVYIYLHTELPWLNRIAVANYTMDEQ